MTGLEFTKKARLVGLVTTIATAQFFGVAPRTIRKWQISDSVVPKHAAMILELMIANKLTYDTEQLASVRIDYADVSVGTEYR